MKRRLIHWYLSKAMQHRC